MTATDGILWGWRILVTRPAHQADALCRLIEAQGGIPKRLPLISIEPLAQSGAAQQALQRAQSCDYWIFTSANAVHHALPLIRNLTCPRLAAVGAATAAALEAAGLPLAIAPAQSYSGQALLELPEFQDVHGCNILIVTGEQGLDSIAEGLRARGAAIQVLPVYRRMALPYPPEQVAIVLRAVDAVVLTSGEALTHLHQSAPDAARSRLQRLPVVVPSERVMDMARQLGWQNAQAPPRMSDNAIVELLGRLRQPHP